MKLATFIPRPFFQRPLSVSPFRRYASVAATICVGAALSAGAFVVVQTWERHKVQDNFHWAAEGRIAALQRTVESALSSLEDIGGLYAASYLVEREEFRVFVAPVLSSHPGIQALEWIPRVPASERAAYEEAARKEGYPDFRFTERQAHGHMVPAGPRDEYFPVYYVEPFQGNEIAFGFDLGSDPTGLKALNRARDTGRMVATARVILVQETGDQFGFLVFKPIYRAMNRKDVPTDTVEQRRDNLIGFGLAVLRIGDIVKASSVGSNARGTGVNLHLFDNSAEPGEQRLFPRSSEAESRAQLTSGLHLARAFDVAGREWLVLATPSAGFGHAQPGWQHWGVLAAGLSFTGLLAAYLLTSLAHTRRIEALVVDLKKEVVDRKRAKEKLHISEARYRNLFEQAPIGIFEEDFSTVKRVIDRLRNEGVRDFRQYFREHPGTLREAMMAIKVLDVNQAGLKMYGLSSKDEYVRHDDWLFQWSELYQWPESMSQVHELYVQEFASLAEGQRRFVLEVPDRAVDGAELLVRTIVYIEDAYKDTWSRVISAAEDITDRKRAEEALHISEARYRNLFEQAPIAIFEADYSAVKRIIDRLRNEGVRDFRRYFREHHETLREAMMAIKVLDVNQATLKMYRVSSKDEFVRHDEWLIQWSESMSQVWERYYVQELASLAEGQPRFVLEGPDRAVDGTELVVRTNVYIEGACSDTWSRVISTVEDITERKRAEEQLRQAQDELVRKERLAVLGRLTATVSHELRNPLGTIRTSVVTIRDRTRDKGLSLEGALGRVERSIGRCDRIVDDLLDYTRGPELNREPTPIDACLEGVLDEQTMPDGITLRRELTSGVEVAIDRDRFRRAVINVFENACQAMVDEEGDAAGGRERIVTVRDQVAGERLEVSVSDTGPGISADALSKVFEPLFTTKSFGVGLGLPTVRQIMDQHGGGVDITSEEGRGTAVVLWLPLPRDGPPEAS